jgi:hypothetical protein
MEYGKDDYAEMVISFFVNGKVRGQKVVFERGTSSSNSFHVFMRYCTFAEVMNGSGSTYFQDMLDKYKDGLGINKEERADFIKIYGSPAWDSCENIVKDYYEGKDLMQIEKEYVRSQVLRSIWNVNTLKTEQKLAVLYYLSKFEAVKVDGVEAIPQSIVEMVDSFFEEADEK